MLGSGLIHRSPANPMTAAAPSANSGLIRIHWVSAKEATVRMTAIKLRSAVRAMIQAVAATRPIVTGTSPASTALRHRELR